MVAAAAGAGVAWTCRPGPPRRSPRSKAFTEYRLTTACKCCVCPDDSKPTVTVNLTVFVGSRHEGYGETGMAHLLEHMLFKGTPDQHANPQGAARARSASSTARPGSTAPTTTRRCRPRDDNLDSRFALEADRLINSYVAPRGPDLGDDGRAQRVRAGRELARRAALPAAPGHGLRMAQLRQVDDRQPQRHRARADRAPARRSTSSFISPTTRCWSSPASSTRPRRWPWSTNTSARSPSRRASSIATYTEEPPQDGERSVMLRRVGDLGLVGRRLPHSGRRPSRHRCPWTS